MNTEHSSEAQTWWVAKNGRKYGPMTVAELKRRLVSGEVSWQDRAWCVGASDWKPLSHVNIFSAVSYETSGAARWPGERNDDSLRFSADRVVSGEIDPRQSVSSGVLDMASLRAAYAAQDSEADEPAPPVFAGEALDVSTSMLLPYRPQPRKPSRLVHGLAGIAAALTLTTGALAALAVGGTPGEPVGPEVVTRALIATADYEPTPAPDPIAVVAPEPTAVPEPIATPTTNPATTPEPVVAPEAVAKKTTRKTVTPRVTKTTRKTPKTTKTTKTTAKKWDEYACLLATDPPPACNVYRTATPAPKQPDVDKPDPNLPLNVTRGQISSAMRKLDYRVERCAELVPGAGLVKVKVKVAPSGKVTGVTATSSPDPKLSSCVVSAVNKASFPETQNGATFAWAFPLR